MATEPSQRLWDAAGNDWASSAAPADALSTPNDGERVAGHVNNTGYTSGRANYLMNTVSQWLQRVRDTLLPQHEDDGGHTDVTVTSAAANSTKLRINGVVGDTVTSARAWTVYEDGSTERAYCRVDGAIVGKSGGFVGAGVSGLTKVNVTAVAGDAATLEQFRVNDSAGALVFSVDTDGNVHADGIVDCAFLSVPEVITLGPRGFQSNGTDFTYYNFDAEGDGQMNIADNNGWVIYRTLELPVGTVINSMTLTADRDGGTLTAQLQSKEGATLVSIGTASITSGTGVQTATVSGLPITIATGKSYQLFVTFTNNSVANNIRFRSLSVDVN